MSVLVLELMLTAENLRISQLSGYLATELFDSVQDSWQYWLKA